MKSIITILILLVATFGFSQTKISGKVVDEKNNPIIGANIFIEGSSCEVQFQFQITNGKFKKKKFESKKLTKMIKIKK